ncbi:hypothetical protein POTOM_042250 [Populus tomentosa]|uniref:Uncharacterized protein n=1 Tax=Populus tomentosa TaxID=118781 RepID=A0A8X7YQI5_POPTO|nr:hypothetical protein POTOM_042250 [Populus tomentosa]
MDLIHKVMNIVLPPITLTLILLFLPSFLVFKFISCIKRYITSERVAGKVVLITGASSGIGEYLAYEYARRGACLALAARREERLRAVADKARMLGSPDVIVISTDISKVEDCERFITKAVNHFGRLDHLVNNAGIIQIDMFEHCKEISDCAVLMNTNFWGSVYVTRFAIPHLRKSKGRIVGISSIAGWCSVPKMSFYCASKAAITSFYETLAAEFGPDIGITIVTPGVVESEMSQGDFVSKAQMDFVPAESTERCAKAIVNSACRGDRYLVEPSWTRMSFLLKVLCPEVMEWHLHWVLAARTSKKTMDMTTKLMNILLPPIALIVLLLILPPYLVLKFLGLIKGFIYSEDVAGKVVLITGASSGIGEQIAYQYARRGARLALVARREDRLRGVASEARKMGSPDVMMIRADVSKVEDCKRFVDEAMKHFGQLDHLVNNAGIPCVCLLEEAPNISDLNSVVDINFWGSVYGTYFAVPHLRKTQGKIIVISSAAGRFPCPRASIYGASKAALISLYESLRIEFGSDIGITIVTPGLVKSEMTTGELRSKAKVESLPVESTEDCAKAVVDSACRGDRYLVEPSWVGIVFLFKLLCPEVLEWCLHGLLFSSAPRNLKKAA